MKEFVCPITLQYYPMFSSPWLPFSNQAHNQQLTGLLSQGQFSFSSTNHHLVSSHLSARMGIVLKVNVSGSSLCFLHWTGCLTEVEIPSVCSQVIPLALWQVFFHLALSSATHLAISLQALLLFHHSKSSKTPSLADGPVCWHLWADPWPPCYQSNHSAIISIEQWGGTPG